MMPNLTPMMIWAATYFIHSSLLLGGVWLWFRWREPTSHAFREAVWKLAAVGGLITASLQLGLAIESPLNTAVEAAWSKVVGDQNSASQPTASLTAAARKQDVERQVQQLELDVREITSQLQNRADSSATQFVASMPDERADETQLLDSNVNPVVSSLPQRRSTRSDSSSIVAATPQPATRWMPVMGRWLTGVLSAICGAVVALSAWGVFRLLSEQVEFRRRLSSCRVDSDGPARRVLDQLLAAAAVQRQVSLMLDEQDLEPGACGWLDWRIVLPARAVEDLSAQELRGLLAHELAHLVRRDQWWLLLGRLLTVCCGWQPLNRIALREWQRASEYLCDAWAIQHDVPRLSLARCLTTVAEWRLVGMATLAGLGSGNPSNLSHRVERLVDDVPLADPWLRYSRRHLLAAIGCVVVVGMVSWAPAATLPERPMKNPAPNDQKRVDEVARIPDSTTPWVSATDQSGEENSGLLATQFDGPPQGVVVTIQTLEVVRHRASTDMFELMQELNALQQTVARSPQLSDHPLWQVQLQRFRQRMEHIQRLRNVLLVPL